MRWRDMNRLGIIALAAVGVFALYKLSYPTYSCRYRMTVNVEVDGQMRSGSSVIEFSVAKQMQFLPTVNPFRHDAKGEAVFVDLGNGRNLVALLAMGEYALDGNVATSVVPSHFKISYDGGLAALPSLRGRWELPINKLPTLVTFSDPNNSASVSVVRPDQLEQIFGPDVHWRGVQVEMTTDAVTRKIESRLPWVGKLSGSILGVPGRFTLNGPYFKQ